MRREISAGPLPVWRIVPRRRAASAWDGEGARLFGGRWNHAGTRVVYASATLSLAALEVFVHADPDTAPELVAIRAELPAGTPVERLEPGDLPAGWRSYPGPAALRDLGTEWATRGDAVALVVPSAVVPQESNLLLNPAHPGFASLHPEAPLPFGFDARMWKGAAPP